MKRKIFLVFALCYALPLTLQAQVNGEKPMKTPFTTPFRWKSSGPLVSAISDENHKLVSIKDPTVVYYNKAWHVYATVADTRGNWNMVYLTFTDWSKAGEARQYYMDASKYLRGYHCAPQVFYFKPQKKWYMIYQASDQAWTPPFHAQM